MSDDKKWMEVAIEADVETADAISDVLDRVGHQGIVIEQAGFEIETWEYEIPPAERLIVRAYFPVDARLPDVQQQIRESLSYLRMIKPIGEPEFRTLDEENWADAWKQHYKPLRLGKRLLVRPRWITDVESNPDDVVINLDPGMAFGTGTHPSTQLCLIATEELSENKPGLEVLDLGCGSGILSIAAVKYGAAAVLAVDTDPIAVTATIENAAQNDVASGIEAAEGSLDAVLARGDDFELALVNILARVIIQMCDQNLGQVVRPGGVGVFGGIIHEQTDEVEAALRKTGLDPYLRRTSGDWVVIEARRPLDS